MPKNPSQAKAKSQAHKKGGGKKFRPVPRGAPSPQKPAGRAATIATSSARPLSSGKAQPIPTSLTFIRGEVKKIGAMFATMVLIVFIFSLLLPRGAYLQAGLLSFLLLFFLFLAWKVK